MSTPKSIVTQAELRRYLRAIREEGVGDRLEIAKPDGTKVSIIVGKAGEAVADDVDDIDAMIKKIPHAATP